MAKNRKTKGNKGKKSGGKAQGREERGQADESVDTSLSMRLGAGVGGLLCVCLIGLLVIVHYGLWLGDNSVPEYVSLNHEIDTMRDQLSTLSERNEVLRTEVIGLKSGFEAVEARARNDLGLVKKGETFFQIIEPSRAPASAETHQQSPSDVPETAATAPSTD